MAVVEETEFKGNKMISLKTGPGSDYPFGFGRKKAELIMQCIPQIKEFAETENITPTVTHAAPSGVNEGENRQHFPPPDSSLPSGPPVSTDDIPF